MGEGFTAISEKAGFEFVSDPSSADIIFAHSGGCFLIPPESNASIVVLVGLPYWPGRSRILATIIKTWRDYKQSIHQQTLGAWSIKLLYHMLYAFKLMYAWQMARQQTINSPWNGSQRQVIIRNRHDAYCSPEVLGAPFNGPRTFISFPGEHDDCWSNPKAYLDMLLSNV